MVYHASETAPGAWSLRDEPCRLAKPFPPAATEAMWAAHNLIAHPICEIAYWMGFIFPPLRDAGLWLHDITIPPHEPGTGRG